MEALRAAEDRAAAALINFAKSDRTAPHRGRGESG